MNRKVVLQRKKKERSRTFPSLGRLYSMKPQAGSPTHGVPEHLKGKGTHFQEEHGN